MHPIHPPVLAKAEVVLHRAPPHLQESPPAFKTHNKKYAFSQNPIMERPDTSMSGRYQPIYTKCQSMRKNRSPLIQREKSIIGGDPSSEMANRMEDPTSPYKPTVSRMLGKTLSLTDSPALSKRFEAFKRSESCPQENETSLELARTNSFSNKRQNTMERPIPTHVPPSLTSTLKEKTTQHLRSLGLARSSRGVGRTIASLFRILRSRIPNPFKRNAEGRRWRKRKNKSLLDPRSLRRPPRIVPASAIPGASSQPISTSTLNRQNLSASAGRVRQLARNSVGWRTTRGVIHSLRWEISSGVSALAECGRRAGAGVTVLGVRAVTMTDNKIQDLKRSISSWSLSTFKKPKITSRIKKPKFNLFNKKKNR